MPEKEKWEKMGQKKLGMRTALKGKELARISAQPSASELLKVDITIQKVKSTRHPPLNLRYQCNQRDVKRLLHLNQLSPRHQLYH